MRAEGGPQVSLSMKVLWPWPFPLPILFSHIFICLFCFCFLLFFLRVEGGPQTGKAVNESPVALALPPLHICSVRL